MSKRLFRFPYRIAVFALVLSLGNVSKGQAAAGDFTIVLFPDTQNEAQYYPQVLNSQTQWVVNNRAALNIQAVLGLGDIVNDGASSTQQQNADSAIRLLDNTGIPYFLAIGNHDYDGADAGAATRTALGFNQWFGPQRYASYPWYTGNLNGSNENFYGELSINGKTYLFLMLEYVPRDSALAWAASVLQANPDKEVIIVTHTFMYSDNTRVDLCDTQDLDGDNYGDKNWVQFASQYPNISMVVSGHITSGQGARRADLGVNGNLVNQMFSNYQTLANGGDGWMRLLTFHPATNTIDVKTYSPYLNAYKTDSANQFTIYWHNPGIVTGSSTITGRVYNAACTRLAGATISAGNSSAVTDSSGNFSLPVPSGSYAVAVNASGYVAQTQQAQAPDGYGPDLRFYLDAIPMCTLNSTSPSVTICQPAANATISSPVQVIAGSTDTRTVSLMQIYLDGSKAYEVRGSSLDTSLAMAVGTHHLTVQAYDGTQWFKQSIYISVAAPPPAITASPSTLSFSGQTVNTTSSALAVTVSNGTSSSVTVSSVATAGDFAQTNNCSTLAAGATCMAQVTFTPTATGPRTGTLSVTTSGGNASVTLSGTGMTAGSVSASPSALTFTSQTVGTTSPAQAVTVSNTTASSVTVSAVAASGDFAQTNNCSTVAAGGNCAVQVTFTPTAAGTRTGALTITNSAGALATSLTGTGASSSSTCTLTTSPSVTICQPAANATVSSPVQVVAGTTDTRTVTLVQIYVDGAKVYEVKASSINTSVTVSAGAHRLTVQAYDGAVWFKQTLYLTVQ